MPLVPREEFRDRIGSIPAPVDDDQHEEPQDDSPDDDNFDPRAVARELRRTRYWR